MRIKTLTAVLFFCWGGQLPAQSVILDLLYTEARNVFLGKVQYIKYGTSNGQGSHFGVSILVEEVYKGDHQYQEISFGVLKLDVIDLELDTMVLDYAFQIQKDSSYVFFTKEIRATSVQQKSGSTSLTESEIEGVPISVELEQVLQARDAFTFLTLENTRNYPNSNFAFNSMKANSSAVFFGQLSAITAVDNGFYRLQVRTPEEERIVMVKRRACICRSGALEIGGEYMFYTNPDEAGGFRLVDEWLGVIEASEYDRLRGNR